MNQNLIIYTIELIVFIGVTYFLTKFTIDKKIKLRDWVFLGVGIFTLTLSYLTIDTMIKINNKLSVEFQVPNDIYSQYSKDSLNNPISEKILYKHLLLMRAPHPEIILAQAVEESGHFTNELYKFNHNFTSMKDSQSRITTTGRGKGKFKMYKDWQECVTDYIFWQFTFNTDKMTDQEYLQFIGKVYAEDTNYLSKIKDTMKKIDYKKLKQ